MGRRRQAYKLEKRGNGIWYVVGTTPDGRRVHRSTRTRSRKAASEMIGCGREDSCVTGIRQSRSGRESTELPDFRCNTQAPGRGRVHRRFDVLVDT